MLTNKTICGIILDVKDVGRFILSTYNSPRGRSASLTGNQTNSWAVVLRGNMVDRISGVYEIRNVINGHRYIGSSVDIFSRRYTHRRSLAARKHHSIYLQRAWDKYGEETFEFSILVICPKFELRRIEQGLLDAGNCAYNVHPVAVCGGIPGHVVSKSTREKMRKSRIGFYHTDETKQKISKILRNKFTKQQLADRAMLASAAAQSNTANAKRKNTIASRTPEECAHHINKLSEAQKKLWSNPDHGEKMSEAHKHYTQDILDKFSIAQKRLWKNPDNYKRYCIARQGKGKAKINENDVKIIRWAYKVHGMSTRDIAKIYGLGKSTIHSIVSGMNWAWVECNINEIH